MVKAQLGTMVEDALKKIKLAAQGLSDNSAKLTETMASYRNTLVHPPLPWSAMEPHWPLGC